jgi:opacity protein-like surface antigen
VRARPRESICVRGGVSQRIVEQKKVGRMIFSGKPQWPGLLAGLMAGLMAGLRLWLAVLALMAATGWAHAQTAPENQYYSRGNTFGFLASYSNDSSHMLLGVSEDRRLLQLGGTYGRRLVQNRMVNWQYNLEVLPVVLESDPVLHSVTTYTLPAPGPPFTTTVEPSAACQSGSGTMTFTAGGVVYSYDYGNSCSRRWTVGEGISPIGMQWNFLPRRKLQPVIIAHGGYVYTTRPIPTANAGSFNFTFDFGVGLELYRTRSRSLRLDYRYHHISDDYTTAENPGIDNGLFTLTYCFGR